MYKLITQIIQWLTSRVAVIYVILFIFCISFVDLKMLDMRIKVRHLNNAIPDFSALINFSRDPKEVNGLNWVSYKKYFELILSYIPNDLIIKHLLGYVDYYMGQEQEAIALFKSSSSMNGQGFFWSNYNLGVLYYKKGMWSQAAESLFKAVSSNTKLTVILIQDATVYKQIFNSPAFKYSLKDELDDAQSNTYILLLSSLFNLKQYEKVILISNIGIANQSLTKKDAFYYYAGLSYLEIGQFEKAFLLLQKSIAIEKDNPDPYYYIANIYEKAGQLQQSQEFLQVSYALHQKHDPRFPYDASVNLQFF